jgi:hypothetical protein
VLTRGFPLIDIQAAGGLYDAITLQIFPDAMRTAIIAALPPLRSGDFLRRDQPRAASRSEQSRASIADADAAIDGRASGYDASRQPESRFNARPMGIR